jgi:3-(methylthio)propionyl---CoA ligase
MIAPERRDRGSDGSLQEERSMFGQMMHVPLSISSLIRHAAACHGDTPVVSRLAQGGYLRYTYHAAHERARRLARALLDGGTLPGERIGTLAWNTHRHFEIFYGVSGIGAICHTINPRLFPEQIAYIVNHAGDRQVLFDPDFLELAEMLSARCPTVERWVALCGRGELPRTSAIPNLVAYEDLVDGSAPIDAWPEFDENTASSLCYTSGTTGNPKGALYSHRSTVLHAAAISLPDALDLSATDTVAPVAPMFHVNAWGLPYAVALTGARLVLPASKLDGASLYELFEGERVTFAAGVPTVWLGLLQHLRENRLRLSTVRRLMVGGAAAPLALIRAYDEEFGIRIMHGWGMTETSPVATVNTAKNRDAGLSERERGDVRIKQGRALYGVEMKIVDGGGKDLPHDGNAFGDLLVRGPWICNGYFRGEGGDPLRDGWFPTGDVATIDRDGFMHITDRSKDVIKSGGEWISSIALENLAIGHPGIAESAVIAIPHPTWGERPLLVVVRKKGASVTRGELLDFLRDKVAKWWLPDDVVFVDSLPHTATGKLLKRQLREDFRNHRLPDA